MAQKLKSKAESPQAASGVRAREDTAQLRATKALAVLQKGTAPGTGDRGLATQPVLPQARPRACARQRRVEGSESLHGQIHAQ